MSCTLQSRRPLLVQGHLQGQIQLVHLGNKFGGFSFALTLKKRQEVTAIIASTEEATIVRHDSFIIRLPDAWQLISKELVYQTSSERLLFLFLSQNHDSAVIIAMLFPNFFTASVVGTAAFSGGISSPFLNFSSPAPYIFSSLAGLLQQWSNTFFPNGHTISACEIPKHTLFYHGRLDAVEPPPSPEWLAFDIEMSYGIMGSTKNSRILTYRTIRPVRCLYFDGMSASLMGSGTESQMTFLYGDSDSVPLHPGPGGPGRPGRGRGRRRPPPGDKPPRQLPLGIEADEPPRWNPLKDEYFRARGLCNWIKEKGLGGNGWGYEGIIRMNAGYELIWCDFNSTSLKLISNLNVSVPLLDMPDKSSQHLEGIETRELLRERSPTQFSSEPDSKHFHQNDEGPHGPSMTDSREPFRGIVHYMWFAAASKRYGSNGNVDIGGGETRAKINTCGVFSFYDPTMFGQDSERIQEERQVLNISAEGRWRGPKIGDDRSLALEQLLKRRRVHRTNHVSKNDGLLMQEQVENNLRGALNDTACSGIPWDDVSHEIIAFYARNLRSLRETLLLKVRDPHSTSLNIRFWLKQVRIFTHWFMLPFFEYPPGPYTIKSLHKDFSIDSSGARDAISKCQRQYATEASSKLNQGEDLLSWAVEETLKGICNTTFSIGLAVEKVWLQFFNTEPERSLQEEGLAYSTGKDVSVWLDELDELMAWLGWVDQ